ncbi:MAG: uncharacterized protein KVP18_005011 [Porospora cf. gigantea A]|uniref:uncharacterized protein n=1 Tax=Porospora cf. gigantea A TaxID=2853593 RepID=UPI00355A0BB8|nr:MAG: hypothetical protein KVP18_005011 [Porospora cf. gigantea A]
MQAPVPVASLLLTNRAPRSLIAATSRWNLGRRFHSAETERQLLSEISKELSNAPPFQVPQTNLAGASRKRDVIVALLPLLWTHGQRRRTAASLGCIVGSKVSRLAAPWMLSRLVETRTRAPLFAVGHCGAKALASVLQESRSALFSDVSLSASTAAAAEFINGVQRLSAAKMASSNSTSLASACNGAVSSVQQILNATVLQVTPIAVEVSMVVGYIGRALGWPNALVTAAMVAEYIRFTVKVSKIRAVERQQMQKAVNRADRFFLDAIDNNELIKAFTAEDFTTQRYLAHVAEMVSCKARVRRSLSYLNAGQQCIAAAGLLANMSLVHRRVRHGATGLGTYALVAQLLHQLMQPLNFVGTIYRETTNSFAQVLDVARLIRDPEPDFGTSELPQEPLTLKFENVSFTYPGAREASLRNVSFEWQEGEKLGVVGSSGSGKTSIVRLLLRLYQPSEGRITLNGIDVRHFPLAVYRRLLSVVSQDSPMMDDTLLANLQLSSPRATAEAVLEALKRTRLTPLLKSGAGRLVGRQGSRLSGGQRQRVGIARSLLRKAPFMILDEATSALDSVTENFVLEQIQPRSTLSIAHRLATVADSSKLLVLSEGAVKEEGTHRSLRALNGVYSELWSQQVK